MGLGFYVRTPASSLIARPWPSICDSIARYAKARVTDPALARLLKTGPLGDRFCLRLHPAEEDVEFWLDDSGDLVCSAKTSTAGPGYHAFLVDWLAGLQAEQGWVWRADGDGEGDETGYWTHRDFARLQVEMCHLLARVCEVVTEKVDGGGQELRGLRFGMPLDYPHVVAPTDAMSSLGFWSRDWLEAFLTGGPAHQMRGASQFYPWWGRAMDAEFWRKMGLVLAWVEVPWHFPANQSEREVCEAALECFERARRLDPSVDLPRNEIAELADMLDEETPARPPSPDGVGFYRREMVRPLTGGWTIHLPGYYYASLEDDGTTQAYWWTGRSVRGSSFSFTRKEGAVGPATEILADDEQSDPDLAFSDGRQLGRASVSRASEENGRYWVLTGRMVTEDSLCHVTICYDDDSDAGWAADCWRRVRASTGGSGG